jgi:cytochrome c oxidase subunit 3
VTVEGRAAVDAPRQPALLTVGAVVWLASEVMFFGGLFAAYFTLRSEASVWPPRGIELETATTAVATVVLIASSFTMHLAVKALRRDDRLATQRWLVVTLALGALFLANQVREFLVLDFGVSTNSYGSLYYTMTGFHGLHVLGGLVLLGVGVAFMGGVASRERRAAGVEAVAYYWHFVDVVWVGLFLTIFVLR